MTRRFTTAVILAVLLLAGCSATIPTDPDGTLDRVSGGTLRAAVSPNPPWTDLPDGPDGDPAGTELALVQQGAESIDAEGEWVPAGAEGRIGRPERSALDRGSGGLHAEP